MSQNGARGLKIAIIGAGPGGLFVTQWPHNLTLFQKQLANLEPDAYEDSPH